MLEAECRLGGAAVLVMQSADLGNGNDLASISWSHGARVGRVAIQRQVRSAIVIVVQVILKDVLQVPLRQHDHMIQALTTDGANDSFDVRILPG